MAEIDRQLYAGPSELDVSFYLKRPYAPLGDRLAALRRHLLGYGGFLAAARDNLGTALPRPNLEIAIEAVGGQVEYLEGEVRAAARDDAERLTALDHGRGYALKTFHDAFLGCGSMPIPLIREVIG